MTITAQQAEFAIKGTYGTLYYVDDVMKAISFIKENLGIQPKYENPDWTEFSINGHSLCLHPKNTTEPGTSHQTGLILHVDNIHHLVETLKQKGQTVFGPHEVYPGAFHASVKDLDGNIISFYEGPKDHPENA